MKLADLVKQTRLEAGMTQQQLATRVGVTCNYISLIESGKRVPVLATLRKIAHAFGKHLRITIE